ncbi:MAG: T9SS type A sorting domain-containing protein [Bacteroidetes bacterium]|nr:T9SS type A sorting domain-containing protein [Bacteroidota bacterium]
MNSIGILEFVPPAANIIASDDTICEYKVVTFYPETEDLFLRYNWSFPGGSPLTSTKEINYIQYFNQGIYPVSLTISNEVGSLTINLSDSIVVNTCVTGIASLVGNENPSVFPNPFVNDIQVKSKLSGSVQYRIWDMYGKLIYSKVESNKETVIINMENFSQGMFILELSNNGFRHTQKIIKQ